MNDLEYWERTTAELVVALREMESHRRTRRRIVLCHPSALYRLRSAAATFPDAALIEVRASSKVPLGHMHIRNVEEVA